MVVTTPTTLEAKKSLDGQVMYQSNKHSCSIKSSRGDTLLDVRWIRVRDREPQVMFSKLQFLTLTSVVGFGKV